MIEIKQVTKKFGKVVAIDNLSLNIEQGIYGLVGQNGAGKSTLFRSICGVYEQDSGEIKIDGFDADSKAGKELVFFLSDDPYVEKSDKINDMLEFYGIFYKINKKKFNKLVSYFGLPYDKPLSKFSKGMKRQAFISLALAV